MIRDGAEGRVRGGGGGLICTAREKRGRLRTARERVSVAVCAEIWITKETKRGQRESNKSCPLTRSELAMQTHDTHCGPLSLFLSISLSLNPLSLSLSLSLSTLNHTPPFSISLSLSLSLSLSSLSLSLHPPLCAQDWGSWFAPVCLRAASAMWGCYLGLLQHARSSSPWATSTADQPERERETSSVTERERERGNAYKSKTSGIRQHVYPDLRNSSRGFSTVVATGVVIVFFGDARCSEAGRRQGRSMFDCMEALGMGPRQLYDVTNRGACMLRKASPFYAGLDPFAWTGTASIRCKCLFLFF